MPCGFERDPLSDIRAHEGLTERVPHSSDGLASSRNCSSMRFSIFFDLSAPLRLERRSYSPLRAPPERLLPPAVCRGATSARAGLRLPASHRGHSSFRRNSRRVLRAVGFTEIEDVDADALNSGYFSSRADELASMVSRECHPRARV